MKVVPRTWKWQKHIPRFTHLYIEVEVDLEEVGQTPEKDAGLAKAAPSYYFGLLGDQPNELLLTHALDISGI